MALVEVKKCRDINCKYIHTELVCPSDWFDEEVCAECRHPDAKGQPIVRNGEIMMYSKSLRCDRDPEYLDIPDWCPLRKDTV